MEKLMTMWSNGGIPMCSQHFGPFFKVESILGFVKKIQKI
jgi:hypothetical protein